MFLMRHSRQHLRRAHEAPIHCPRCSRKFDTTIKKDHHIHSDTCEKTERKIWEGVTEYQKKELSKRKRSRNHVSIEQKWYLVWDILFPNTARPSSPCQFDTLRPCRPLTLSIVVDFQTFHQTLSPRELEISEVQASFRNDLADHRDKLSELLVNDEETREFMVTEFGKFMGRTFTSTREAGQTTTIAPISDIGYATRAVSMSNASSAQEGSHMLEHSVPADTIAFEELPQGYHVGHNQGVTEAPTTFQFDSPTIVMGLAAPQGYGIGTAGNLTEDPNTLEFRTHWMEMDSEVPQGYDAGTTGHSSEGPNTYDFPTSGIEMGHGGPNVDYNAYLNIS
jgi:hypothetical protein